VLSQPASIIPVRIHNLGLRSVLWTQPSSMLRSAEATKNIWTSSTSFTADDIETSSATSQEPIRGKARVRELLFSFLVPLHAMAEVGRVSISVREAAIPGEVVDETHSARALELVGLSGKIRTMRWRTFRKWNESRVVAEHHYDLQQSGGPLTHDDLSFSSPEPAEGLPRPSKPTRKSDTGT
jgi:hypothetical protein